MKVFGIQDTGSGAGTKLAGKLISARSEDESLNFDGCFWWLSGWKQCATHTVAGMFELYEQLLPTRLYACQKTHRDMTGEVTCRLCNKAPESVAHVLAGCTALAPVPVPVPIQFTRRTMRKRSGMSLYLRSTKELQPTELMLALSTTCQSDS